MPYATASWLGVAFSSDGKRLTSASQDNTARLRDADGDQVPDQTDCEKLCTKLTFNMSTEQGRVWVSPDIAHIPACPDLPIPADHTARA